MPQPEKLFTRNFLTLNIIIFLAFCNVAVMFKFFDYLNTLPIPRRLNGLLIGIFPITALVLRPLISPLLHQGNARRWISLCSLGSMTALWAYVPVQSFWSMAMVRLLHGSAYVGLAAATIALMVCYIPPSRSGQAFGLISVSTVLPYALLPPLLDPIAHRLGGFQWVMALTSLVILPALPLLLTLKTPPADHNPGIFQQKRINGRELAEDLKYRSVSLLLLLILLFYSGFAVTFFFINSFASKIGITNPGYFFTLSASTTIAVRLLGGLLFDRLNKVRVLAVALLALAAAYLALTHTLSETWFYSLAVFFGLCWGVTMPLLNALMYEISPTRFQGLNINLATEMIDGGFFLGPLAGGIVLANGGYILLHTLCGASIICSLALLPFIKKNIILM